MKSNKKYKMFVSESSIYPQNFMSINRSTFGHQKMDHSTLPSFWTKMLKWTRFILLVEYISTIGSKVWKWILTIHISLYLTLRSKVWNWILAIHSLIDRSLYLTLGSKVLRWILTIHSLINRSLSKFIFHLTSFTFLASKDCLLLLSFSFLALSQKPYGLNLSYSVQVFLLSN